MGSYLGLVTLGDANIRRVLEDPPLVWRVVSPYDRAPYEAARMRAHNATLVLNVFRRGKRTSNVPDLELSRHEGVATDLDVAWRGVHYLLTGTARAGHHPYNFLLRGGREVGDIEVGYGPARVLSAAETRFVHRALSAFTPRELVVRFEPERMLAERVYPGLWGGERNDEAALDYLLSYTKIVCDVVADAAANDLGLVIHRS